jgi:S-adenosylmethionine-diacylglycerol 3-amino-3-carboxypropyl transferase
MLKKNPIQFSVVREDPIVEISLIRQFKIIKPILIGSGGCTAFALASEFQKMPIALIEPNPAQVKLIKDKIKILETSNRLQIEKKFGVGQSLDIGESLIEKGNFESLFRSLRSFIYEFIVDRSKIEKLLLTGTEKEWKTIFSHPYWPVAFDLFFSNSILLAMFGPAAIQHAPPESYSEYFRQVFENGLIRRDRQNNYFLHHVFLGRYLKRRASLPAYLQKPPKKVAVKFFQCTAQNLDDYSPYDFVSLSNIFDWSSENEIRDMALKLNEELKVGTMVLYRQLNNRKNFRHFFGDHFQWLSSEAKELHLKDRSLFYSSIHIARKLK